ncbi:MAG: homoserine O-acetyltransferase MetX [Marmoricola sp.]
MTTTRRALIATPDNPLLLANDAVLTSVEIAYATFGTLNERRDNAVVVAHALTGDVHADRWWASMVGPGKPVDTERFFVICPNILGGCAGSTGPSSMNPDTGKVWGTDFPLLAMTDLVAAHRRLLDHLGIERLHAAIGGSLGGMQVLQWASDAPGQLERAILIASSARLTAQNIALSAVARHAIVSDPDFHDGRYLDLDVAPRAGLAVARMLGHITYLSEGALDAKFGRARTARTQTLDLDFEVERYLDHQGSSFVERFDALSYLYLTRVLDYFDPFADPAFVKRIAGTRFQLVSFDSDWRFPTSHSAEIEEQLRAAGVEVERHEVTSPGGHDSFLLEPPGYLDLVRTFLGATDA